MLRTKGATMKVTGTFDVRMQPLDPPAAVPGSARGRLSLDKRYHGALDAVGEGQMLSAMSAVKGSAGYVAIERVSGTLEGRAGSFVIQHHGLMDRGAQQLAITIVPDTGTDALAGITGTMAIRIEDGRHFYDLDYEFRGPAPL